MTKVSLIAATLIAVTPFAANAQTYQLRFGPYELDSHAGRMVIANRIERVARKACAADPRFVAAAATVRSCTVYVKRDLAEKIGNPLLTELVDKRAAQSFARRSR